MNIKKFRQVHDSDTKVYNCTFQLHLYELRILLKFPCRFFIEWKTANGTKSIRTQGLVECINGNVVFNQNLLIETQMLYNINSKQWLRKKSTISVYLITKNKPDFNQLAGRINIDLSLAIQNNPYQQILTQSLTHASTSADLKFSLQTKYSLQSQKPIQQVDLLQFSDRLLYVGKGNDQMSKSKSMGYLKISHSMISPDYQLNSVSQIHVGKIHQQQPLQFPKMKLQNLGHQVFQSVEMQSNNKSSQNNQFNIRMTLGPSKKHLSRQDYELMIDQQTKGMKKSDLMVVPNMKKSGIEQDDSQFNTQRSKKQSQDQFPIIYNDYQKGKNMRKTGSQKKCQLARPRSPQSQIDINVDQALLQSRQIHQSKSNGMMITNNIMMNSMHSSNSFSISQFRAQFQNSGPQNFSKVKSPKQSTASLQVDKINNFTHSMQRNNISNLQQKYQFTLSKAKQLQSEVNELKQNLANNREKSQKLQDQLNVAINTISKLEDENKLLQNRIKQLQQKAQYESKINLINCEKLKKVSSELTIEKSRMRSSESSLVQNQVEKLRSQMLKLNQTLKKLTSQNDLLKSKLQQRDDIELQNQIRIQQLQQLLQREKSLHQNKNTGNQNTNSRLQSKFTKKQTFCTERQSSQLTINYYEQKIKHMQSQKNLLKKSNIQKDKVFKQKTFNIQNELAIIEKQFQTVISELISKQKLLAQRAMQVQLWKTKSYAATFTSSAQQQLKNRSLQEELKKKQSLINSYQLQLQQFQKQIQKLQGQNHQLAESYNKLMRQSYRFQGELKVIKEEQSYRQSFGSSGGFFNLSGSHGLTFRQEHAINSFKQTVQRYNEKFQKAFKVQVQFLSDINDIRKKIFRQIQTATNVIIELLTNTQTLQEEIFKLKENQFRTQNQNKLKQQQMQSKIQQFEQNLRISAGSSYLTPFEGGIRTSQNQKFDQYSQATKKKSLTTTMSVQTRLTRQIQKLKSIVYDKNKEISDLIASYEKLKFEKQTQSVLMRSKRTKSLEKQSLQHDHDDDQSDAQLVHDILDLQIRLNKQKQTKNLIMQELQLRKSLNRSQQISQNIPHFDLSSVYKEIRAIITSRQNYITTEETLQNLVIKINELNQTVHNQHKDKSYKLSYLIQEKSRILSKQLQVMKSAFFKLNSKGLESIQIKTFIAKAFKPVQHVMDELIALTERMVNQTIQE